MAGLLLTLVFLGVLAVAVGVVKAPRLVQVTHHWGDVTHDSTQVLTDVELDNPNTFDINTRRLSFQADIAMNEVALGRGSLEEIHLPRGVSTSTVVTHLDNERLTEWWGSHLAGHEFTTLRIKARGVVHLLGRNFTLGAPDLTRTVETDLLGAANSADAQVINQGQVSLLLKSRQLQWGQVTTSTTEILGSMLLRNTGLSSFTVTSRGMLARMNSVLMAQATATDTVTLLPGQDVTVPFRAVMDNSRLLDWWPTHVNGGERTTFYLQITASFQGVAPDGSTFIADLPLLVHQDQFVTHLLGE